MSSDYFVANSRGLTLKDQMGYPFTICLLSMPQRHSGNVAGTQWKRLTETLPLSTHNKCHSGKFRKL